MSLKSWSAAQIQVARDTKDIVQSLGLSDKIVRCCVITQMVESSLRGPIPFGDKPGWKGAYQQHDLWVPGDAANTPQDPRNTLVGGTFLFVYGGYHGQKGVVNFPWWKQDDPITCQQVQQSNIPTAYQKVAADADAILAFIE